MENEVYKYYKKYKDARRKILFEDLCIDGTPKLEIFIKKCLEKIKCLKQDKYLKIVKCKGVFSFCSFMGSGIIYIFWRYTEHINGLKVLYSYDR